MWVTNIPLTVTTPFPEVIIFISKVNNLHSGGLGKLTNAKCRDICHNIPREIQVHVSKYKYTSVCQLKVLVILGMVILHSIFSLKVSGTTFHKFEMEKKSWFPPYYLFILTMSLEHFANSIKNKCWKLQKLCEIFRITFYYSSRH